MARWTAEQKQMLKDLYGVVDTEELAKEIGVSADTLRRAACREGLSKPWPKQLDPYRDGNDYVIPLCSRIHEGKVARIDADDFRLVQGHRWHVAGSSSGVYYARTNIACKPRDMSTFILYRPDGHVIDHIDGDGLNNRRDNLRVATQKQNAANMHHKDQLKGVRRQGNRWVAQIRNGYVGSYETPEEAARAYDQAAVAVWGEFACLNYPNKAA